MGRMSAAGSFARAVGDRADVFLMLVIISVATDKRVNGAVPGRHRSYGGL